MDADRFDQLARSLAVPGTRRHLVRVLAALPLGGTLTTRLGGGPEVTAEDDDHGSSHRRHRRKAKHRHQTGNKEHRKGKRKGKRKDKGKGTDPDATSCTTRTWPAGSCGSLPDGCGGTLSCGGCGANQRCLSGSCRACDVCQPPGACPFSSVQAAINATAPQLTTIVVCPGEYVENAAPFDFAVHIQRSLHLIGAGDGPDAATSTILRPAQDNQFVVFINRVGGTSPVTLEGLRVTGGSGVNGDGLRIIESVVELRRFTITGNGDVTTVNPGGILAFGAQLTLIDTRITGNTGSLAGGMRASGSSQITFDPLSRVTGNTATDGPGGIVAEGSASVTVRLPSVENVTGNTSSGANKNCGGDVAAFTGPGAICTVT